MRTVLFWLTLIPSALLAQSPQEPQEPARLAGGEVSGRWLVNTDFYGSTIYFRLALKQDGEKFTGNFDGYKLEGTLKGNTIYFPAKDTQGGTINGTVVFTHTDDPAHPETPQVYGGTRPHAASWTAAAP